MATVLVLDDDSVIARLMSRFLSRDGYAVRVALECEAASAALEGVDVAIIDVGLSCCTGDAFATEIVQHGIPVILTSGNPTHAQGWSGPFLAKPWQSEELLALLRSVMSTHRSVTPFGATGIITLDPM
jgi:DNA-binding response OmpR family regulator